MEIIRTTFSDIREANRLAGEVFGATLDDMSPQTRNFLERLHEWVAHECDRRGLDQAELRFTRRDVREALGLSADRTRVHLERLTELEYVGASGAGRGRRVFHELLYDGGGANGEKFLAGLAHVDKLRAKYGEEADE